MNIGENIRKFRKVQGMSQAALAEQMYISRQSVSKWENQESLPSIENLIVLSGILEISLDELITGEAYLHFPYKFGKLRHQKIAAGYILLPTFIMLIFFAVAIKYPSQSLVLVLSGIGIQLFLYPLLLVMQPFQLSRMYTYWQLTKTGIRCPIYQETNQFKYLLPIKGLFKRKDQLIPYHEITQILIEAEVFPVDPSIGTGIVNAYTPRMLSIMYEPFQLVLSTKSGNQYKLDLQAYYQEDSPEREVLYSILLFLKRKQIVIKDPQQLLITIKQRGSITDTLYGLKNN